MDAQHIDRFIGERCILAPDAKTDDATLFRAFAAWAHEKGVLPFPGYQFFRLLDATGQVQRGEDCFLRIRLQERFADPPPVTYYVKPRSE